jgi:hypothetical protein
MSDAYGPADDAESIATIRCTLDLGVILLDGSPRLSISAERRAPARLASDGVFVSSRDAKERGQIHGCNELGMAMMAYSVLGLGMLSAQVPRVETKAADDVRAARQRTTMR